MTAYLLGLATLPALAIAVVVVWLVVARTSNRDPGCSICGARYSTRVPRWWIRPRHAAHLAWTHHAPPLQSVLERRFPYDRYPVQRSPIVDADKAWLRGAVRPRR